MTHERKILDWDVNVKQIKLRNLLSTILSWWGLCLKAFLKLKIIFHTKYIWASPWLIQPRNYQANKRVVHDIKF